MEPRDGGPTPVAETTCALRDGVQHVLKVGRRGGNDAQDFAGDGLLLQGLADLSVALLKLGVALLQITAKTGYFGLSCSVALTQCSVLRLKLRDPRVWIVRHRPTPAAPPLLSDRARIAREGKGDI